MSSSNDIPYDTNVSNIVSMKLSGKQNYYLWKAQMLCLLHTINACGILDDTFVRPGDSGHEIVRQFDNLVRGWILGSISEDVLLEVYQLDSAKAVWEKLQSIYDPPTRLQQETNTIVEEGPILTEVIVGETTVPIEMETKNEDTQSSENKIKQTKLKTLKYLTIEGDWPKLESMLVEDKGLVTEAISSDGSTILHIAVGVHHKYIVAKLVVWGYMAKEHVSQKRDSDGSTALHIAAIVGNTYAAKLLIMYHPELLQIQDRNGEKPLQKAYANMHLDTIAYLLQAVKNTYPETLSSLPDQKFAINLLVNAISAKRYSLALEFINFFPEAASRSDDVLKALAKTFPGGLDNWEKLIYPSLQSFLEMLRKTTLVVVYLVIMPPLFVFFNCHSDYNCPGCVRIVLVLIFIFQVLPVSMLGTVFASICLLILIVCFPFVLVYYLLWKGANILSFPPVKKIEKKIMEHEEARNFLVLVSDKIDDLNYTSTHHPCYTRPILEAASHNAYDVVEEILARSPEAIQSKDERGYDIIQLAIINRSEKIYNLIYVIDERKNLHKYYKDSFGNNILHLAGRLAPSSVLNQRTGAALQLQRELQWLEEVKNLVIPTYITQENIFKETPDMVFTKEHKDLVKEGEQWMKTTAESCSITAALITTIVFAAAITVPGGSNQEKGTPLFRKEMAFIIFAISDAISLFASSTALLVFLSILTTRFAEKDFLVSLPWRLFVGLFSLLLSTTAMMVAFSATLFLVFCDQKLWTLAPICGFALISICVFVGLQFPLMIDLFSSTYLPIFGKEIRFSFKYLIDKSYMYTNKFATIRAHM